MEEHMINLETFANGAFAERTNQALKEVLENIADPNTDFKLKRKISIDLTFVTNEDRELIEVDIIAKPKLAPRKAVNTRIILDKTLKGEVLATEFKKQIPGQQAIKVDTETGELLNPTVEDLKGLQIVK